MSKSQTFDLLCSQHGRPRKLLITTDKYGVFTFVFHDRRFCIFEDGTIYDYVACDKPVDVVQRAIRLKALLKEHHMSQVQLAGITGISVSCINRYVNAQRSIGVVNAHIIAQALSVSPLYILGYPV